MILQFLHTLALFLIWLIASYLGTFVSGGTGSLSVWLMILLGLPPQIAKGTHQVGLFGWSIAGIHNFFKSGHIRTTYLVGSIIATFLWAFIGATLMTYTPNSILMKVTGIIFLIYLGIAYIRSKRTLQEKSDIIVTKLRRRLTYIGQFFLSILSGYIPGASGPLYFILYSELLHIQVLEYKALGRITGIVFALWTLYPIIQAGLIHIENIVPFFIGMYLGWHFGSKHIIQMWNKVAQYIVYTSIFFLALYLLFS